MAVPGFIERVFRKRKEIWLEMNRSGPHPCYTFSYGRKRTVRRSSKSIPAS